LPLAASFGNLGGRNGGCREGSSIDDPPPARQSRSIGFFFAEKESGAEQIKGTAHGVFTEEKELGPGPGGFLFTPIMKWFGPG
jgi:hypothetical protein